MFFYSTILSLNLVSNDFKELWISIKKKFIQIYSILI